LSSRLAAVRLKADHARRKDGARLEEARAAYRRAIELVHSDAERRFLERRLTELDTAGDPARSSIAHSFPPPD
jgi:predicted RNA polymerase sigma factor